MAYPGKIRIIAGQLRGRVIKVLNMQSLRPTASRNRETLFNWLQPKIRGARCLDCFAGTGILGFEALSRGAQSVTLLDQSSIITAELKKTQIDLKLNDAQCQIITHDIRQWLHEQSALNQKLGYDILFFDPPFESDLLKTCMHILENSHLLNANAWIYIEIPAHMPLITPSGWAPFKSKKAGSLSYHLLAKI